MHVASGGVERGGGARLSRLLDPPLCSKWSKDYLSKIGVNVCSGVRYGCKCNVLRDGEIRFIST